jgi:hypothetical protein
VRAHHQAIEIALRHLVDRRRPAGDERGPHKTNASDTGSIDPVDAM